jgi:hypothetical protein
MLAPESRTLALGLVYCRPLRLGRLFDTISALVKTPQRCVIVACWGLWESRGHISEHVFAYLQCVSTFSVLRMVIDFD